VIAPGVTPVADVHCPLLDLPYRLRTTANNVPGAEAYLHADPALIESWRSRIAPQASTGSRLRAGLVWGNDQRAAQAAHERVRQGKAVPPQSFAALAGTGAAFFSLQLGATPDELAGTGLDVIDSTGGITDFADTAAIIGSLDLVISADTSVAHLAGAMGKPVILLLGEAGGMLWPQQGRHTPWYSSMTIVRQQRGEWSGAIEEVRAMIGQMASQPPR
jgi:Glycosyltransferase family 9 (heptosyltransferase)